MNLFKIESVKRIRCKAKGVTLESGGEFACTLFFSTFKGFLKLINVYIMLQTVKISR